MRRFREITSISAIISLIVSLVVMPPAFAFDPLENDQWYLNQIQAKQAWQLTKGDNQVVVAVLDTGVDLDHPDLQSNLWNNSDEIAGDGKDNDNNGYIDDVTGWNFIENSPVAEPNLDSGFTREPAQHGTFISGLISAIHDNNFGIKGVTANVKIMPLAVLDAFGVGGSFPVAEAINYAVDNGADVINLSFGGDEHSNALKSAILRAYENDVTIVAAAGNNLPSGLDLSRDKMYPVCYDQEWELNAIIGVTSTDRNNNISFFTNFGGGCVDIAAPGEEITSTTFQDKTKVGLEELIAKGYKGSSFSTALVSGTVALMKSVNPNLTNVQINQILSETATNIDSNNLQFSGLIGSGLLNTFAAVQKSLELITVPTSLDDSGMIFYVSADKEKPGSVRVYDSQFSWINEIQVFGGSVEGLNVSSADLDGDGVKDLLSAATKGSMPFVRGLTQSEVLISSFLAYEPEFRGGVRVSAGDVDGDGLIEYVVVPESQRAPYVRIFDHLGNLQKEFQAFPVEYTEGTTVAVGNLVGDSKAEIIIGSPIGNKPEVKIFDETGQLLKTFLAFEPSMTGGVNVSVANLDASGYDEVIVGAGINGGPNVRVFQGPGIELARFTAYNPSFNGGIRVAAGDLDGDGKLEIVTAPGSTGGPHVRIWSTEGILLGEFFAFEAGYTGGIQVGVR